MTETEILKNPTETTVEIINKQQNMKTNKQNKSPPPKKKNHKKQTQQQSSKLCQTSFWKAIETVTKNS